MTDFKNGIRRILMFILYCFSGIICLIILICIFVQIPLIQNYLIQKGTSYLNEKLKTEVSIRHFSILFTGNISLSEVYLADQLKDTLLYAGNIDITIDLPALLNKEINIRKIDLDKVKLSVTNNGTDSIMNYQFILDAFNDSTKNNKSESDSLKTAYSLSISNLNLSEITLNYNDRFHKTSALLHLNKLSVKSNESDLKNLILKVKEIQVSGLTATVDISPMASDDDEKSSVMPELYLNKIDLDHISIKYSISGKPLLSANIGNYSSRNTTLLLDKYFLTSDNQVLSNTTIVYNKNSDSTTTPETAKNSDWNINIKQLSLKNNAINFRSSEEPINNNYNKDNFNITSINFVASDLRHSNTITSVNLEQASLNYGNLSLRNLKTKFVMTNNTISARNMELVTSRSDIKADIILQFKTIESMSDSPGEISINALISQSHLTVADILWYNPKMSENHFFSQRENYASIKGHFTGKLNKLNGTNLIVKTGIKTTFSTSFDIAGLPDIQNASLTIPAFKLQSGKQDITKFIESNKLKSINIPEELTLSGKFNGSISEFTTLVQFNSTNGNALINANKIRNSYSLQLNTSKLDLGYLLKNTSLGPSTIALNIEGSGFDSATINSVVKLKAAEIYFNKYNYKNLSAGFDIIKKEINGSVSIRDTNIEMDLSGLINLDPSKEQYKIKINIKGADLKQLQFTKDELGISLSGQADIKGNSVSTLNGEAGISQLVLAKNGKKYILDSLLYATVNEKGNNNLNFSSAIINLKYKGTIPITGIGKSLAKHLNYYFPFTENEKPDTSYIPGGFNLAVKIIPHPVISEVFLPSLNTFEIDPIEIIYDSENKKLETYIHIIKLVYDSISITDAKATINSDIQKLNYDFTCSNILNNNFRITNFQLNGAISDSTITSSLKATTPENIQLLNLHSITKTDNLFTRISISPDELIIAGKPWQVDPSNYISLNKSGFIIHNLTLKNDSHKISLNSAKEQVNEDLTISFAKFRLDDISEIIKKEKLPLAGIVDGNFTLKHSNRGYGFIADASVKGLNIYEVPAGDLQITATREENKYVFNLSLIGDENYIQTNGNIIPVDSQSMLNLQVNIDKISMKTIQSILPEIVSVSDGNLSGKFNIKGRSSSPNIDGSIKFNNVSFTPAITGSACFINDELITIQNQQVIINNFTITDENKNRLTIEGIINDIRTVPDFDLTLNSTDFQLLNSTVEQNKEYYGRIIIDSKISIKGNKNLPVITSKIHLKKNSEFTFVVPEKKLSYNKGGDVVIFNEQGSFHSTLNRIGNPAKKTSALQGYDISSIIEVDKDAVLRILIDPSTNDSLIVKGETALNFGIDPSGKVTLTGTYNLYDGSYIASLESIVRKKFSIQQGSTITWNGEPTDADLNITAIYTVRTSPIDLMSTQISGMSETEQNNYRMRIPINVLLKMNGALLKPEIKFEIQLPPAERGILGGAVNTQLALLNEDESELNKQVFALLVLGRFIQPNPLETETNGVSTAARTSVSKFLTQQLNQLSSSIIKGVDLSFDVQSYDDFSDGSTQGRTELGVALEKKLLDERLTVQVGGSLDVEGEKSSQNNVSDLTGDVTVEYALTKDGRYRLKGFRHNQYEGILEGQLIETGAGILYNRDFNTWKTFFRISKEEMKEEENDEPVPNEN